MSARVREVVRAGARRLVEVLPDSPYWSGPVDAADPSVGPVAGAIVRLLPPPEASDELVAEVERAARRAGAVAVRVAPRKAAGPGPEGKAAAAVAADEQPRTIGQVLGELLAASKTKDPERLHAVVQAAVTHGLGAAPRAVVPACSEPLWPVRVEVENWYRFRGKHELLLGPTAYGIAARAEGNAERSNWLGKSSLLTAIGFALYGVHTKTRDDDWITNGEERGGVEVVLSDGSMVSRTRKRGSATQVRFVPAGGKASAHQAAANAAVEAHVGLSEGDFAVVGHVRQKEVDLLVRAKPAARLELFASWMPELGVLREAEDWVRRSLQERSEQERRARSDREAAAASVVELLRQAGKTGATAEEAVLELSKDGEALRGQQAAAKGRADRLRGDAASLRAWVTDATNARLAEEAAQELAAQEVRLRGVDAKKLRDGVEEAQREAGEAQHAFRKAKDEVAGKQRLAAGEFDGRCPLVPMDCPAREKINGQREQNGKLLHAAISAMEVASAAAHRTNATLLAAQQEERQASRELERVSSLRREIDRYRTSVERIARDGAPPPDGEADAEAQRAWQAAIDLDRRIVEVDRIAKGIAQAVKTERERAEQVAAVTEAMRVLREALAVVGRMGAQRAIAERELRRVERGANELLSSCGIDLSVALRWGRESTGELAGSCDACGAACTGKGKGCPRCGAERGPKVDPKVELDLSDRSGAADDLGGLAVRVAAGAWLRDRRGSAWRSLIVDEPFGALDGANRRALAAHLAAAARGGGYRQALVVAHDAASMAALPDRVTVVGLPDGTSRLEVPHAARGGADERREEAKDADRRPDADLVGKDQVGRRRARADGPRDPGGAGDVAASGGADQRGEAPRRRARGKREDAG